MDEHLEKKLLELAREAGMNPHCIIERALADYVARARRHDLLADVVEEIAVIKTFAEADSGFAAPKRVP